MSIPPISSSLERQNFFRKLLKSCPLEMVSFTITCLQCKRKAQVTGSRTLFCYQDECQEARKKYFARQKADNMALWRAGQDIINSSPDPAFEARAVARGPDLYYRELAAWKQIPKSTESPRYDQPSQQRPRTQDSHHQRNRDRDFQGNRSWSHREGSEYGYGDFLMNRNRHQTSYGNSRSTGYGGGHSNGSGFEHNPRPSTSSYGSSLNPSPSARHGCGSNDYTTPNARLLLQNPMNTYIPRRESRSSGSRAHMSSPRYDWNDDWTPTLNRARKRRD